MTKVVGWQQLVAVRGIARKGRRFGRIMKKNYRKPELKTRHLELGVFGDYSRDSGNGNGRSPISVIRDLNLRME